MNIQYGTKWIASMIVLNLLIIPSAMAFNASVMSKYSFDNNIYKTKNNKSASNIMMISPKISDQLLYKGYSFDGNYVMNYRRYIEVPEEDALTQTISFNAASDAKAKYSGTLGYVYRSSFDVRGESGAIETEAPDVWVSNTVKSSFLYRTDDRRMDYRLIFDGKNKRYSIDESKVQDNDSISLSFVNEYRLTGKSTVNYRIKAASINYVSGGATRFDSFDMTYLVGFSWKYSGKVDASASVGWGSRRIVEGGGQRFSDAIAKINIDWAFKSYSRYQLSINRNIKANPKINAVNSVVNSVQLTWSHIFTRKISTNIGFRADLTRSDTGQSDALGSFTTAVQYKAIKGLLVSPSLKWKTFKSTESGQEYDNYVASLMFTWAYSR